MDRVIFKDKIFYSYEYSIEEEFEKHVMENANNIFGPKSIYINIKKKISKDNIATIPDAYLIDFTFEEAPRLYIIENELVTHDPYKHIGQQLLKFAISYKASGRNIKNYLLEYILKNKGIKATLDKVLKTANYRNIDAFLENIIYELPVSAIVVIDRITSDLENVVNQITMKVDLIEFQAFTDDKDILFKYTPFQQEIRDITEGKKTQIKLSDLDTIVVPANEDGFNEVFLGQNCWYAIRISSSMIDRIKYIAGYQTAPISAITHYSEVANIEKYKDSGKYIVNFKESAKEIGPIKLTMRKRGAAPQAPRYTNINKLLKAKIMSDVF